MDSLLLLFSFVFFFTLICIALAIIYNCFIALACATRLALSAVSYLIRDIKNSHNYTIHDDRILENAISTDTGSTDCTHMDNTKDRKDNHNCKDAMDHEEKEQEHQLEHEHEHQHEQEVEGQDAHQYTCADGQEHEHETLPGENDIEMIWLWFASGSINENSTVYNKTVRHFFYFQHLLPRNRQHIRSRELRFVASLWDQMHAIAATCATKEELIPRLEDLPPMSPLPVKRLVMEIDDADINKNLGHDFDHCDSSADDDTDSTSSSIYDSTDTGSTDCTHMDHSKDNHTTESTYCSNDDID